MGHLVLANLTFKGRSLVTDTFIETGTHEGKTLANMVQSGLFKTYHSIELRNACYQKVKPRFVNHSNIHLHLGSSPGVLREIIDPSRSTTFWLDAHYQGRQREEIDPADGECPLLGELEVILAFEWEQLPVIIIDDAEIFRPGRGAVRRGTANFDFKQWPTTAEIKSSLGAAYDVVEAGSLIYGLPKPVEKKTVSQESSKVSS